MSADLHVKVVGIDLGTTNSLIAIPGRNKPQILANERGERMTPSVVTVNPAQILVGELAKAQAVLNHENTVAVVKRHMGTDRTWNLDGSCWSPEMIASEILRRLKKIGEEYSGEAISAAVITVPAYFDDRQRLATLRAGELAGLKVCKLFNEPTAAALAYGLQQGQDDHLLVFDLGGGTLDITLLEIKDHAFLVKGVGGSTALGGVDFDALIVEYLRHSFLKEHGIDLALDPIAMQQLVRHAERAKIDLSSVAETRVMIPYLTATSAGPVHLNISLSRATLERLFAPILADLKLIFRNTLAQSSLEAAWIHTVIMVGGASRIPCVRDLLASMLPDSVVFRQDLNPEEIVAMGAGILAGIHAGIYEDISFVDVSSHDLGIEDDSGDFVPVFRRGTAYPAELLQTFTTAADDQAEVTIHVLQQGEKQGQPLSLGWFVLQDLPPAKAGEPEIRVTFAIDSHGILRVKAEEVLSGVKGEIQVARV